ncbi:MAG: hypothetical protein N2444_00945 [Methylocystis sp.]|nr:hypothetical protein [Methylocystis sp.]
MTKSSWRHSLHGAALAAVAYWLATPIFARAQMALPGAVAPTPEGATISGGNGGRQAAPSPKKKNIGRREMGLASGPVIMAKAPSEDTIIGKSLKLDGGASAIEIGRSGADLQVTKLTLAGDRLTRSGEECRVDVAGMPLKLSPLASDSGLRRYQVAFPACAFTFDVLDGAILVTNDGKACELKQVDCRADPEGLWGLGDSDFDPKKGSAMLGARARVEKNVRANFRALYQRHQKEADIRAFVIKEQAGFSSWREEVCRDYAHESDYGYCALRLTEARAIALSAQLANGVQIPSIAAAVPAPTTAVKAPESARPADQAPAAPPPPAGQPPGDKAGSEKK